MSAIVRPVRSFITLVVVKQASMGLGRSFEAMVCICSVLLSRITRTSVRLLRKTSAHLAQDPSSVARGNPSHGAARLPDSARDAPGRAPGRAREQLALADWDGWRVRGCASQGLRDDLRKSAGRSILRALGYRAVPGRFNPLNAFSRGSEDSPVNIGWGPTV